MKKMRVLFVNQEIEPYVVGTQMASQGLKFPQEAQSAGCEVRTFMPKFGVINERRNQLHEVIRLSGLNLVIAGVDHPLIIKVASLQALRLQVYFIDNEDYFLRRGIFHDEFGAPYEDNIHRALFFAKGVLETVKKLRWRPDIIHCNGWFTSFIPPLVRNAYASEPLFSRARILTTLYEDDLSEGVGVNSDAVLTGLKITDGEREMLKEANHGAMTRLALNYSHVAAQGENGVDEELLAYAKERGLPCFDLRGVEDLRSIYSEMYEEPVGKKR